MSIIVNALTYTHPDRELLFDGLTVIINAGDKAALVGNNGVGKSTLLKLIAGTLPPTAGTISLTGPYWYIPQHTGQFDGLTVAGLLGVEPALQALQAILTGDAAEYHFATLNDDWDIEERIDAALAYWHLQHLAPDQPVSTLSGGEKTKLLLAGVFIHTPSILLMDEPSNHLDAGSRQLLYTMIQQFKGTVLVVSHDRVLLNQLNQILELSPSGIEVFGGNYAFYREQKEAKLNALHNQLDEQEKQLRQAKQKAQDLAEQRQRQEIRGKAQGQTQGLPRIVAGHLKRHAEQSTARLKEVHGDKLQDLADSRRQLKAQIQASQVLKTGFGPSELHRGKLLIDAQAVQFRFGQRELWPEPLTFQVRSGDRIRIEGNNGSGKTTLLKLMTGQLTPVSGQLTLAPVSYAYLDQEYSLIQNGLTVIEQVQQFNTRLLPEHDLKMLLHYHQFTRDEWDRPCADLSGGEKMKLALCCLIIDRHTPGLLILDEPTNNLDRQSQDVLIHAVKGFTGTLLVISHDQHFIEEIAVDSTLSLGKSTS